MNAITDHTSAAELDERMLTVRRASTAWASTSPRERADALNALADGLAEAADEVVAVASAESLIPAARLTGEFTRTLTQLRLAAEVVLDGSWLDVSITTEVSDAAVPLKDHRRMNVALGPVIVFAASNFPLAFGVLGTDTASAWAAGCAVVAKGHPGHPRLARLLADSAAAALAEAGLPQELFTLVEGDEAAVRVLQHPIVQAGAFTGSIAGGVALTGIAQQRPVPIPFYAEMGSVNPVIVTPAAWAARRNEIEAGLVASMTVSNGQLCTSPGVLFAPSGSAAEAGPSQLEHLLVATQTGPMVSDSVADGFRRGVESLQSATGVTGIRPADVAEGRAATPAIWSTSVAAVQAEPALLEERFGPSSVLVEYEGLDEVLAVIDDLDGQLTASVFAEPDDDIRSIVAHLENRAGRILLNDWPIGVAVSWSMHHGGPWPSSSNALYGSVGAEAIKRFLRPVAYQNFDERRLPEPLRSGNPWQVPQRVDGTLAASGAAGGTAAGGGVASSAAADGRMDA